MTSPHICLACRRRISQIRPRKAVQWLPKASRASFISLANISRTTIERDSKGDRPGPDEVKKHKAKNPKSARQAKLWAPQEATWENPGDELESLFQESLKTPDPQATDRSKEDIGRKTDPSPRSVLQTTHPPEAGTNFSEQLGPNFERSLDGPVPTGTHGLGDVAEGKEYGVVGFSRPAPQGKQATVFNRNTPGDQLEILFKETLNPPLPPTTKSSSPEFLQQYKNAENLKVMVASEEFSAAECWGFFLEHFGPSPWKREATDSASTPSYLSVREGRHTGRSLFRKILLAKVDDPTSTILPTFTHISRVYLQLDILDGRDWSQMLIVLMQNILRCRQHSSTDLVQENALILDLLGCWNAVFRQPSDCDFPHTTSTTLDWSKSPKLAIKFAAQLQAKKGSRASLAMLAPVIPIGQLNSIPLLATATFALLPEDSIAAQATVLDAVPFTSVLRQLIALPNLKLNEVVSDKLKASNNPQRAAVQDFVRSSWDRIRARAGSSREHVTNQSQNQSHSQSANIRGHSFVYKKLQELMARHNPGQVDVLWSEVMHYPVQQLPEGTVETYNPKHTPNGVLGPAICNNFILVYMALRQPNSAINVWNHMIKKGLQPNLTTWDSMLSGCKLGRDPKALEGIWAKMQALKVNPDVVCWTTRVSGLIECNRVVESIRALDEMGRAWLRAARTKYGDEKTEALQEAGDIDGVVKPTIATINAAIAGLLRRRKPEEAHRVLAWAAKFGIRPDVYTYNTLLRPLIREGQVKHAMGLLQQMRRDGIEADVATFTTLLEETFRYSESHTAEDQQEIIAEVFTGMEDAGIRANLHTYGKIMYHLLLNNNIKSKAIQAVMARMAKQGLQPGPHIYTMLVQYHFSRSPPDLDAVRALIERSKEEIGSVDHIFWDRVIEGYSHLGDTASAIRILGKASGPRSWYTLQDVLTALVKNGEWDTAKTLVRNAKLDSGGVLLDPEVKGKEGQHQFWRLVAELDLLNA